MIENVRVFGPSGPFGETEEYTVGLEVPGAGAVTAIMQRDQAPEPYCCVSFIEVWCGDHLYAEFPKQNVAAIYHADPKETTND